jgi:nucleotide-binding universal stress UspA family protein
MKKFLVAVDGSESSLKAAKKAAGMCEFLEGDVTILTVLKDIDYSTFYDVPSSMSSTMSVETLQEMMEQKKEEFKEEGRKIVKKAAAFFETKGIETNKVVDSGSPADVICDFAEDHDIDMIVLADRGRGGIKRFLLGSISDKVVRHANTSVLVVK